MKFTTTTPLLSLLALQATATTLRQQQRDLATANSAMGKVLDGMKDLSGVIVAYNGGTGAEVYVAASRMIGVVKTATSAVAAMTNLSIPEAQAFQPLSDKLNAQGDALLAGLDGKVALFQRNGICPACLTWVEQLSDAVFTLMKTITLKFPNGGQGGSSSTEIPHFTAIFNDMIEKLTDCSNAPQQQPAGGAKDQGSAPKNGSAPAHESATSSAAAPARSSSVAAAGGEGKATAAAAAAPSATSTGAEHGSTPTSSSAAKPEAKPTASASGGLGSEASPAPKLAVSTNSGAVKVVSGGAFVAALMALLL